MRTDAGIINGGIVMDERVLTILGGDESKYPHALEQQYARILENLVLLWNSPRIEGYFFELMVDTRNGSRHGFPTEVAQDIMNLQTVYHNKHQDADYHENPWDEIPELKRAELEQLGYTYSHQSFMDAVEKGSEHAVGVFLSCGIKVDSRDEREWTPLMISSFNGNEEMAVFLIRCGAQIQIKDRNGYTPLHWAAFNGYTAVVDLLIQKGAEINARSQFGWTPLMQAATRGHTKTVKKLLDHKAYVDEVTTDGWTALHKASANGHTEIVQMLLGKGANRTIAYPDGSTALTLATLNKHEDIIKLLSNYESNHFG